MAKRRKSQKIQPLFGIPGLKGVMKDLKDIMKEGKEFMEEFNELAGHAEKISENLAKANGEDDGKYERVETKSKSKEFRQSDFDKEFPPMTIEKALKIMELKPESNPAEITAKFQELNKKIKNKVQFMELYIAYKKLMEQRKHFVEKGKPRVVNEP
jgi:predicted nuclease with TOPRIM domain